MRRPEIAKVHRLARWVVAQRIVGQVDIRPAGQRIGHHQRRGGQVVRSHVRMDAGLKISISRKHRRGNQVGLADGLHHLARQRAAVSNTCRAAITHNVESQFRQRLKQPRLLQIFGDDPRAGRHTGLYIRLNSQTTFHRIFRKQPCADHDGGVGSVGARGDGRNYHRTVPNLLHAAVGANRGGDLGRLRAQPKSTSADFLREPLPKDLFHLSHRDAVLGESRAGQTRFDGTHVQFEYLAVSRVGAVFGTEKPLRLAITLHQIDQILAPACQAHVTQSFIIHREVAHGRAVFGGHVSDGCPIRE